MTTQHEPQIEANEETELVGSRIGRIDPDTFSNQSDRDDGPAAIEADDADSETTADSAFSEETTDADGDPTGEHDHVQDDNFYLGGHVTRSGSV